MIKFHDSMIIKMLLQKIKVKFEWYGWLQFWQFVLALELPLVFVCFLSLRKIIKWHLCIIRMTHTLLINNYKVIAIICSLRNFTFTWKIVPLLVIYDDGYSLFLAMDKNLKLKITNTWKYSYDKSGFFAFFRWDLMFFLDIKN